MLETELVVICSRDVYAACIKTWLILTQICFKLFSKKLNVIGCAAYQQILSKPAWYAKATEIRHQLLCHFSVNGCKRLDVFRFVQWRPYFHFLNINVMLLSKKLRMCYIMNELQGSASNTFWNVFLTHWLRHHCSHLLSMIWFFTMLWFLQLWWSPSALILCFLLWK